MVHPPQPRRENEERKGGSIREAQHATPFERNAHRTKHDEKHDQWQQRSPGRWLARLRNDRAEKGRERHRRKVTTRRFCVSATWMRRCESTVIPHGVANSPWPLPACPSCPSHAPSVLTRESRP